MSELGDKSARRGSATFVPAHGGVYASAQGAGGAAPVSMGPDDVVNAAVNQMSQGMYTQVGAGWDAGKSEFVAWWGDIAQSYGWMHEDACRLYRWRAGALNVPVIIISTFTGAATATLGSLFSSAEYSRVQPLIAIGLGMLSLLAGVLGTLEQKFKFTQLAERHERSSSDWRQLWRVISACLALQYEERAPFRFFLENMQTTVDALMDSRPDLPPAAVAHFARNFGSVHGLRRPHECGVMLPTNAEPLLTSVLSKPMLQLQQLASETHMPSLTPDARSRLQRATSRAIAVTRLRKRASLSLPLSLPMANVSSPMANVSSPMANVSSPVANVSSPVANVPSSVFTSSLLPQVGASHDAGEDNTRPHSHDDDTAIGVAPSSSVSTSAFTTPQ